MKILLTLFASVALNIALGIAYLAKPAHIAPLAAVQARQVSSSPVPVLEKLVTNVVTVIEPAVPFDWRKVESDDYRQYVANLRAIGCPEKTLRDIIMADITDLFRQRARNSTSNRFEYWKPGVLGNAFDEKRMAQQQAQADARRQILATLLGTSYSANDDPAGGHIISPMEEMTGDFLSPEKQAAMKALEMKYATSMLKAAKDGGGDDSEAIGKVMADKDAEMLALLSPDEKLEYDLRLSQPAIMLRLSLGEFEPTEEEFRQMFHTAKKFMDTFGPGVITRLGNARATDGEISEMLDGFRTVLGEQRFEQFQRRQTATSGQK